jgi:hypothetical protein
MEGVGAPMVNTDGTAYVKYEVRNTVNNVVTSDTLYLMQINPDNSSSSTVLSATTQNETQYPGNIIPDGNGGVLATWSVSMVRGTQPTYPYEPVDFNSGAVGTPYYLPFSPQSVNIAQQPVLVLGENGVAFASGWNAYRIYRTLPDGTLQSKQSSPSCKYCYEKNLLNAVDQADPLIDGNPDPWLAPVGKCDTAGNIDFP